MERRKRPSAKGDLAAASLAAKKLLKLFGLRRSGPYTSHTKPESVEMERFPVLRPGDTRSPGVSCKLDLDKRKQCHPLQLIEAKNPAAE